MSFDVYVQTRSCEHCGSPGHEFAAFNVTHNLNALADKILVEAGAPDGKGEGGYKARSWGRLHGWQCSEAYDVLQRAWAISVDSAREPEFRAMEPSNGWGSLDGLRNVLHGLCGAAASNPKAFIEAHG